jgi:hypothetical protein
MAIAFKGNCRYAILHNMHGTRIMAAGKLAQDAFDAVRIAIDAAYEQGYAAGRADALKAIMRAASDNLGLAESSPASKVETRAEPEAKTDRAPRGAVRQAVINMLKTIGDKGATTTEITSRVHEFSDGIELSGLSASNELQRQKGKLYSQDSSGYWHLIVDLIQNEKPVDDSTVESPSTGFINQPQAQGREAGPGGAP